MIHIGLQPWQLAALAAMQRGDVIGIARRSGKSTVVKALTEEQRFMQAKDVSPDVVVMDDLQPALPAPAVEGEGREGQFLGK